MAEHGCDILLIFPPLRTWDCPRNFPTGPGLIAARLREAGYRVRVLDANGLRMRDEQVLAKVCEYDPAVVGIGGLITTYGWVKRISWRLREMRPEMPVVLGGSVGGSIVETALRNLAVDVIAVGEADDTVGELLPALLNGESLEGVAGLAYLEEGRVRYTAARELRATLDDLPYPAWDLFPMEVYLRNPVVGMGKDIDIISSRGCPFNCQYCYKIFGRKFRGRSAEHVVGEMEALRRNYEVDFVSFQDDCFVIDKGRVYEICDLIDRSKVLRGVRWSCNGRVTVCDLPLLERVRASGCISVAYGVESGSQRMLDAMQKRATLAQVQEAIENTRKAGLRSPLAFMMGYPGETRETVMETVEFCKKVNIPLAGMTFTCPYPGTALYEQVLREGKIKKEDEEKWVLRMGDAVDLTINLTEMEDEELVKLRAEALALAKANYRAPSAEELARQERELYGEELYARGQEQRKDPRMQAHLARHGFNENLKVAETAGAAESVVRWPAWLEGCTRPYVIAEAGVNHNGRQDLALELVDAAYKAGANCVKFQAFSADELTSLAAEKAEYQEACGEEGESQHAMLKRYELEEISFKVIKQACEERGIDFLVTPFSVRWLDFLVGIGMSAVKIGSVNIGAPDLLEAIGRTRLPVILSTGMSNLNEVDKTISVLGQAGTTELAVLHCVSLYPASLAQANLYSVQTLAEHTGLPVGFSDHTVEVGTGALAVAAGAAILEKHMTLAKDLDGPDHRMSLTPGEMAEYVQIAREAARVCGSGLKEPTPGELIVKKAVRLSVVAKKFIAKDTVITREMLTTKRPGTGIPAAEIEMVIDSAAACDILPDSVLRKDQIIEGN